MKHRIIEILATRELALDSELMTILLTMDITAYDRSIVISLQNSQGRYGKLTPKQHDFLYIIAKRYTVTQADKDNWFQTFDTTTEMQTKWATACNYYKNQEYPAHKSIAASVIRPSQKQYKLLVENKYFAKIWNGVEVAPKYPAGTMVKVRASYKPTRAKHHTAIINLNLPHDNSWRIQPWTWNHAIGKYESSENAQLLDQYMIVVTTNVMEPISACAGCKIYSVLPFGSSKTIRLEERMLKVAKI